MYMYMYVCMYVCVHIYIYIYIRKSLSLSCCIVDAILYTLIYDPTARRAEDAYRGAERGATGRLSGTRNLPGWSSNKFVVFLYLHMHIICSLSTDRHTQLFLQFLLNNRSLALSLSPSLSLSIYIYIYIHIWIEREREREREIDGERERESERERYSMYTTYVWDRVLMCSPHWNMFEIAGIRWASWGKPWKRLSRRLTRLTRIRGQAVDIPRKGLEWLRRPCQASIVITQELRQFDWSRFWKFDINDIN